jgi:hypothetical protein
MKEIGSFPGRGEVARFEGGARPSGLVSMSLMNERSILSVLIGSLAR